VAWIRIRTRTTHNMPGVYPDFKNSKFWGKEKTDMLKVDLFFVDNGISNSFETLIDLTHKSEYG
jgi:hypothetical protein